MSETKIEWSDLTWNVITGCTPISEGCENCYAKRMAKRLHGRFGYPDDDPFRPGTVHLDKLDQPRHWKKPRRIFVSSMGDLFHEDVDDADILSVFNVMRKAEWHTFMILTKRAERMQDFMSHLAWRLPTAAEIDNGARGYQAYMDTPGSGYVPENIQVGVTVENQKRADERIPYLLETPAAVRFVSCEPLLSGIDLPAAYPEEYTYCYQCGWHDNYFDYRCVTCGGTEETRNSDCAKCGTGTMHRACPECESTEDVEHPSLYYPEYKVLPGIDGVIAGGESGPWARPTAPEWARSLRDQCLVADVPFCFKRWGEWLPIDLFSSDESYGLDFEIPDQYRSGEGDVGGASVKASFVKKQGCNMDVLQRAIDCDYTHEWKPETWDQLPEANDE